MLLRAAVGGHRCSVLLRHHGVPRCRSTAAAAIDTCRHPSACSGHLSEQTLSGSRQRQHRRHRTSTSTSPSPSQPLRRATNVLVVEPVCARIAASKHPLGLKSGNRLVWTAAAAVARQRRALDGCVGNRSSSFSSSGGAGAGADGDSVLLRILGPRWSPYGRLARIDKPAGTLLLLFPCWWSIALAAPVGTLPDAKLMALFATGAVLMRSAGCTINDLWDRDLDRRVARTKERPLASGELGNSQAIAFLGGQLTLGLGVLLSLNTECIKLGFAVMPLVVAYPLMKRYTDWPQAVLGLTFNWGAIMGWAAVHGSASWHHVLPLYGAGVCWTLVYDTLYGHQDKADDKRLGIRSTALLFGDRTKPILAGFGAASVGLLAASGFAADLSWPFYAGTAAAAGHLAWQIRSADLDDPARLFKIFRSNQEFGALIFASIVCGHF